MEKSKYSQLKLKAVKLRKEGLSYDEIKKQVPVSKGSLSLWLKTIPLTPGLKKRFYTANILNLARGRSSQKERRKREIAEIIKEAEREIKTPLAFETYRFIGAALYWAEGDKTKSFEITNSDPNFILFMVKWFEKVLEVFPSRLNARLNIYPQQNDQNLKQFWSQLTGIPIENFGKSFVKPLSKGYKKNNLYYGTIKIRVIKGTDFRHRVYGWIKVALKEITPNTELVEKEWKSLKELPRPINLPKENYSPTRPHNLTGKVSAS